MLIPQVLNRTRFVDGELENARVQVA
jgi:hypothetical protein